MHFLPARNGIEHLAWLTDNVLKRLPSCQQGKC